MDVEVGDGLPIEHQVRHDGGDVVVGIDINVQDVHLEGTRPCEGHVGREFRVAVIAQELQSGGLVRTGVGMSQDVGLYQVIALVEESVELEIQAIDPLCGAEGELERINDFGLEFGKILT